MIGVSWWSVAGSETFQNCFHKEKNADAYKALHQSPSVIVRDAVRVDITRVCVGDFTDKNEGALTILATLVVAIFTYTLWRSTDRLRIEAQRQREDFAKARAEDAVANQASLAVSQKSADAAMLTAKNMLRTARPLCVMDSLRLSPFEGAVPDIKLRDGYYFMSTHGW